MKKMDNKGFSLVELIIVIAIMAILIGVLAPQFIKYVESSRESTDLQNIAEVKTAIEAFAADNELTPSTEIKVEVDHSAKTITVSGMPSGTDLSEYGVTSSQTLKSGEWNADFTWTYKEYSWGTPPTAHATYYNADGSKVSSTSTSSS